MGEEGVGIIFTSCFCYWFAAVASLKMPRDGETEECTGNTKDIANKESVNSTLSNDDIDPKVTAAQLCLDNRSESTKSSELEVGIINSDDETDTIKSWDQSPYCRIC